MDTATFRSALRAVCGYRPQGTVERNLSWIGRDVASSRDASQVDCSDPGGAVRHWTTGDRGTS